MGFNPKIKRHKTVPRTAAPLVSPICGLRGFCLCLKVTLLWLSFIMIVSPAGGGLISADFVPQLQLPDCSEAKQRSASLNSLNSQAKSTSDPQEQRSSLNGGTEALMQECDRFFSLVFVSTIDGRLSALNGKDSGQQVWSIETAPGPLLSSSIHKLELTNNGQFVRMIPSLSGGLYKFNGENVEIIPVTADDLLHSSVRFSENLVMTGGKELRNYGIDVLNGRVLYECSLRGCQNSTEPQDHTIEEVLLVQRKSQTVRAIDPRTSYERWNFSVAHHTLSLIPDPSALCHSSRLTQPLDLDIRIIAPEGLVCGISRTDKRIIWKHKFETPVVAAWTVQHGELQEIDLFSGSQWTTENFGLDDEDIPASPSLYVGMHKRQVYIQESVQMQRQLNDPSSRRYMITDETNNPKIPWHPIPARSTALGLLESEPEKLENIRDEEEKKITGVSVLYGSEYVNGNGFFLFSKEAMRKKKQCGVPSHNSDNVDLVPVTENNTNANSDKDQDVYTVIAPFWYWWKEIILISMTSALILNVIVTQRFFNYFKTLLGIEAQHQELELQTVERRTSSDPVLPLANSQVTIAPPPYTDYTSRYLQEFQPVRCLGKGGFGVVFEARKKFDECLYAVKRIPLTNKEESRERMLREVRALAKLDHNNIVRYFNSWLEQPPPGWQQLEDEKWSVLSAESGSDFPSVADDPSTFSIHKRSPAKSHKRGDSVCVDIQASESSEPMGADNIPDDADDSYIVFAASEDESKSERVVESESDGVSETSSSLMVRKKNLKKRSVYSCVRDQSSSPTSYLFIQMQLCRKESLKEWLKRSTSRDYSEILNFFEQIVQAVEYVHLNGLIHRDLKPSNIFFSMDGQIKVGDFGLVTTMLDDTLDRKGAVEGSGSPARSRGLHTAQVGTELYMSPEQRAGSQYNYKVDIYSLGLILFELLVPFFTEMERITTLQNLRRLNFPQNFDKNYTHEHSLLTMMLSEKPEKRPTTVGIRSRPPLKSPGMPVESSEHHFELPPRTRNSFPSISSSSSSGSVASSVTVVSD